VCAPALSRLFADFRPETLSLCSFLLYMTCGMLYGSTHNSVLS